VETSKAADLEDLHVHGLYLGASEFVRSQRGRQMTVRADLLLKTRSAMR